MVKTNDFLHGYAPADKVFRQKSPAHATIFGWFEASSKQTKRASPVTVFKKTRIHSSVAGDSTINNYNNSYNNDTMYTRETSPPSVKQVFSFTSGEQGAVIEPLLNIVEKAIYKFLVDNERYIPSMLWNLSVLNKVETSKKKLDDTSFGKITEFVLDILEETEKIEEGDKRKILRLTFDEDEHLIKLWRAIKIEEK
ncbi:unnamed protein product [Rhizophagus irregularis]|nr:unnamed protein product [Rhizophagus irregularis]